MDWPNWSNQQWRLSLRLWKPEVEIRWVLQPGSWRQSSLSWHPGNPRWRRSDAQTSRAWTAYSFQRPTRHLDCSCQVVLSSRYPELLISDLLTQFTSMYRLKYVDPWQRPITGYCIGKIRYHLFRNSHVIWIKVYISMHGHNYGGIRQCWLPPERGEYSRQKSNRSW